MKKNKSIRILTALFAVVLCMAAFPLTAFAMTDTEPPKVTAAISGDNLHVTATDNDSGVEAVFVNGKRYNYLVDGGIDIPLKDCGEDETISVSAIDFAGNQSDAVEVKNPNHTAEPNPATINPVSLTPEGNLTLVDDIDEQDGESYKQFITVVTKNGEYFYIVIDRAENGENNVHFLNLVDESDLLAILEELDEAPQPTTPAAPEPTPEPEPEPDPAAEPEAEETGGGMGGILLIVILLAAGGGAFYYFKVLKPKQAVKGGTDLSELDELDFDDEGEFFDTGDDGEQDGGDGEQEDEDE